MPTPLPTICLSAFDRNQAEPYETARTKASLTSRVMKPAAGWRTKYDNSVLDQGPIYLGCRVASNSIVMDAVGRTIAVVDDEEGIRKALQRLLASTNFRGVTYATGADFLQGVQYARPDCLVLDLQMPGCSGLDVLARLSALGLDVPTVIITAHDEPGSRQQCLAAGAAAYLCKPLDDEVLLASIESAIARTAAPQ